ncbi:hypothetical protein QF034_006466 [Streptomyces africanus]|uniref:Uncharacterized protein n=1 Tax=Streptomyces africanus TaxID=231024 RepID=A0ABU0QYR7_9ACTN|nr:hypothetical protein [Streptomyces africanus]
MPAHLSPQIARRPDGSAAPGAFVALAAVALLLASGCSGSESNPDTARATTSTRHVAGSDAAASCRPAVKQGSLPPWARKGFPRDVAQRHVIGDQGHIAAVLFGYPYHAPAADGRENKILWVAKDAEGAAAMGPDDRLTIKARLAGTNEVVNRSVAGGPARPSSTCRSRDAGRSPSPGPDIPTASTSSTPRTTPSRSGSAVGAHARHACEAAGGDRPRAVQRTRVTNACRSLTPSSPWRSSRSPSKATTRPRASMVGWAAGRWFTVPSGRALTRSTLPVRRSRR